MGVRTVTGLISVLGMLVLASPGVRAERVEAPAAHTQAGPQCSAETPAPHHRADGAFIAELGSGEWRRRQAEAEARGIVVLNGQGFHYPQSHTDPRQPPSP